METIIAISDRGTVTLPKSLRKKYGLTPGAQLLIEDTAQGLLLRPAATFPVELYTEERIEEFQEENDVALADVTFE